MTPNLAYVGIETPQWRGFRLWIPLFLLWIPIFLLAPLLLLALLLYACIGRVSPWQTLRAFWAVSCALPGTHIHVNAPAARVLVRLI